jgi:hypothetical protein
MIGSRSLEKVDSALTVVKDSLRDLRHITTFMRLRCASDLLALGLFPDAKEITESVAAYQAVMRNCSFLEDDKDVTCVCIADGATPRTAALFAFMTKWQVISIDPALREKGSDRWKSIQRLTLIKDFVENIPHRFADKLVIVGVHAHNYEKRPAKGEEKNILTSTIIKITAKEYFVVTLPCCHDLQIPGRNPDLEYFDPGIWSDKNLVRIWK